VVEQAAFTDFFRDVFTGKVVSMRGGWEIPVTEDSLPKSPQNGN
jgi:hypothetical protein